MKTTRWAILMCALVGAGCGGGDGEGGAVTIIRGAPEQADWLDLTIEAHGMTAEEGTPVIIQVGIPDRPPERLGTAEPTVVDGGFTVQFPQVWESGLYKQKVLVFDHDGDGACGEGDTVVADWSAAVDDVTMEVAAPIDGTTIWGNFFASDCELFVSDWPAE